MADRFTLRGDQIVLDQETGLEWQRGASAQPMVWKEGFAFIDKLNEKQYAGHNDWRYPTKEELATLIMPEEDRHTGLYVNPLFGDQRSIWSSTEGHHHQVCYADFYYGDIYLVEANYANLYIRAVRNP